ncbi:hypothetical protein CYMTET_31120, partial [Cymbomonas tetramitiformis]
AAKDEPAVEERPKTWRKGTGPLGSNDIFAMGGGMPPVAAAAPVVADEDEVDPLDAFMSDVTTEVKQVEELDAKQKLEARVERAKQKMEGKDVKAPKGVGLDSDSDEDEPEPDATVVVPTNKVKLIIGKDGENIKWIQKKSKCRLQVKKTDEMIYGAHLQFGASAEAKMDKPDAPKETTIYLLNF